VFQVVADRDQGGRGAVLRGTAMVTILDDLAPSTPPQLSVLWVRLRAKHRAAQLRGKVLGRITIKPEWPTL
jgi:hypothetical protein